MVAFPSLAYTEWGIEFLHTLERGGKEERERRGWDGGGGGGGGEREGGRGETDKTDRQANR